MSTSYEIALLTPTPSRGWTSSGLHPVTPHLSPIGVQALEIISSILDDPSPGLADIKLRLRSCVANHPGHPEQALLAHLTERSSRANSKSGPHSV